MTMFMIVLLGGDFDGLGGPITTDDVTMDPPPMMYAFRCSADCKGHARPRFDAAAQSSAYGPPVPYEFDEIDPHTQAAVYVVADLDVDFDPLEMLVGVGEPHVHWDAGYTGSP